MHKEITQSFRPRARLIQLLGDELIGGSRLAVLELVKNAYDADANEVVVTINLASNEPTITVEDDGEGMSMEILQSVWLVLGNDHRQKQRRNRVYSRKYQRLPLGEKGLGRFAVHKLGDRIRLTTRASDHEECVVDINWNDLIDQSYLDEAPIKIINRPAQIFTDGKTGTHIEIHQLRMLPWTRGKVRHLYSQITSICSPFKEPGQFHVKLIVPDYEEWIKDLPDLSAILERAPWKFKFTINNGRIDWIYEFRQVAGLNLDQRRIGKVNDELHLPDTKFKDNWTLESLLIILI